MISNELFYPVLAVVIVLVVVALLVVIARSVIYIALAQYKPDTQLMEKLLGEASKKIDENEMLWRRVNRLEHMVLELESINRWLLDKIIELKQIETIDFPPHVTRWIEQQKKIEKIETSKINTVLLKSMMTDLFSDDDLESISYDVRIETSGFPTDRRLKSAKIIEAANSGGKLNELVSLLIEMRPKTNWDSIFEEKD